jgi:hypothetical protein
VVRFKSLLLAPVIILGMPSAAGLNRMNSTSAHLAGLGTQTAFDFYPPKNAGGFIRRGFDAPLQQASLSQNAQWRSQKPFTPCAEYCSL